MKELLYVMFFVIVSISAVGYADPIEDRIRDNYLHIDPSEVDRLAEAEAQGLMNIKTVILPEGENFWGNNRVFGWPVAAMIDDTIVVVFRRRVLHYNCPDSGWEKSDEFSGESYIRSTDAGLTWGPMVDIMPLMSGGGAAIGSMPCIGVNRYGEFLIKRNGILRSTDKGQTWTLYNTFGALSQPNATNGPELVNHPYFGVLSFNSKLNEEPYPIWIRRSNNGYSTWSEMPWFDDQSIPHEPAVCTWDGNILLISREGNLDFANDGKTNNFTQHLYKYDAGDTFYDINFKRTQTNVLHNNFQYSFDTPSVMLNPVTNRIELLQSHRWGGQPGYEGNNTEIPMSTLLLWSIDPQELLDGSSEWRFEGPLLIRNNHMGGSGYNVDGLHPAGAVIDTKRNVQHIFIYAGDLRCGYTGIFHITRTLDTPTLSRFLKASAPNHAYAKRWILNAANLTVDKGHSFVTVKLASGSFDYSQFKTDGSDIYFTDAAGYPAPHKILKWNPAGQSRILVRIRALKAGGSENMLNMYWGDKDAFFHQYDEQLLPQTGSMTVSFWIKNAVATGNYTAAAKTNGTDGWGIKRVATDNNSLVFNVQSGVTVKKTNFTDTAGWHHIVGVIDRTENKVKLYFDGALTDSADISASVDILSASAFVIADGASADVSDIAIFKDVLSQQEITAIYQAATGNTIPGSLVDMPFFPQVSVSASTDETTESGPDVVFTISRAGDLSAPMDINYQMSGTATNGTDYEYLDGLAFMDAAENAVQVILKPLKDEAAELDEDAVITILPSQSYELGEIYSRTIKLKNVQSCLQRTAAGMLMSGDFNKDCVVDLQDFARLASQWLEFASF